MTEPKRVASIDVLRGVALVGILVMNIQSFAMPHTAYLNPTAFGSLDGLEGVAWSLGRLFFDFKFISLFSTLFGASLVLAGTASNPRRRLLWLVGFGLLHGYLVWYGDILFTYGVVGLAVLPALTWTVRRQVTVGLALLVVSSLIAAFGFTCFDTVPAFILDDVRAHYEPASVAAEVQAFRSGWLEQFAVRARRRLGAARGPSAGGGDDAAVRAWGRLPGFRCASLPRERHPGRKNRNRRSPQGARSRVKFWFTEPAAATVTVTVCEM